MELKNHIHFWLTSTIPSTVCHQVTFFTILKLQSIHFCPFPLLWFQSELQLHCQFSSIFAGSQAPVSYPSNLFCTCWQIKHCFYQVLAPATYRTKTKILTLTFIAPLHKNHPGLQLTSLEPLSLQFSVKIFIAFLTSNAWLIELIPFCILCFLFFYLP